VPVADRITQSAGAAHIVKFTTDDATLVGSPVRQKAGGTVGLAAATSRGVARVVGLCLEAKAIGFAVRVVLRGVVERTDWTAVAGTATLTPGLPYWLDTTAGKITTVAPTSSTDIVARIGRAISTTKLDVQTEQQTVRL
jgi:hypothetical protein